MQVLAEQNDTRFPYLERFSSLRKAIKVVAYVRKFIEMTIDHIPESKKSSFLTAWHNYVDNDNLDSCPYHIPIFEYVRSQPEQQH